VRYRSTETAASAEHPTQFSPVTGALRVGEDGSLMDFDFFGDHGSFVTRLAPAADLRVRREDRAVEIGQVELRGSRIREHPVRIGRQSARYVLHRAMNVDRT